MQYPAVDAAGSSVAVRTVEFWRIIRQEGGTVDPPPPASAEEVSGSSVSLTAGRPHPSPVRAPGRAPPSARTAPHFSSAMPVTCVYSAPAPGRNSGAAQITPVPPPAALPASIPLAGTFAARRSRVPSPCVKPPPAAFSPCSSANANPSPPAPFSVRTAPCSGNPTAKASPSGAGASTPSALSSAPAAPTGPPPIPNKAPPLQGSLFGK